MINIEIQNAIRHLLEGTSTRRERENLLEWIHASKENQTEFFILKDLWDTSFLGSGKLSEIEKEEWIKIENRIRSEKLLPISILKKGLRHKILNIAAVFILSFLSGWGGHYLYWKSGNRNESGRIETIIACKGQVKEIFLSDGTHVWLNADSKLSFPMAFISGDREVSLEGEAYFEVASDFKNPFIVTTKNHKVKVTGTCFNVCEYPESNIIETTLEEGRVKILSGNLLKDLFPGHQSSFNTETSVIRISRVDFKVYTAWKDGRYELKNEPLEKIMNIVERWWDVKVDYDKKSMGQSSFTVVIKRHKPVEHLFELINQAMPIDFRVQGDLITVKKRT